MIEGVAGPETANNAYANAAMIPLFTLGIPASPTLAILMGALMMNGLLRARCCSRAQPVRLGRHCELRRRERRAAHSDLPLIPMWSRCSRCPNSILFALILGFAVVGAYSVDSSVFGSASCWRSASSLCLQEAGYSPCAIRADPHPGSHDGESASPVAGDVRR